MKEGSGLNYRHKSDDNTHSLFLSSSLSHSHSFFFTEPIRKFIVLFYG